MENHKKLQKLQRSIYLEYQQDGILDIIIGINLIAFSLFMATEIFHFLMLAWLPFFLYMPLKKRITQPRFGYVQFTTERVSTMRSVFVLVMGVIVLLVFLAFIAIPSCGDLPPEGRAWLQKYHMSVLGGLAGLLALGAAVFLGLRRFYLYALMAVGFPTLGAMIGLETFLPVLISGTVLLGTGLVLMVAFLRKYPLSDEGEPDA
jgi:hypothetical protein